MSEVIIENVRVALCKTYCSMEDMMQNHDITKEIFLQMERDLASVARLIGVHEYYPFEYKAKSAK